MGEMSSWLFLPPGTAGLLTLSPMNSQTPCPQGQLCAKPCLQVIAGFLTLGCEQGCPTATQAKQTLKIVDSQP